MIFFFFKFCWTTIVLFVQSLISGFRSGKYICTVESLNSSAVSLLFASGWSSQELKLSVPFQGHQKKIKRKRKKINGKNEDKMKSPKKKKTRKNKKSTLLFIIFFMSFVVLSQ